jgi:hypothetical protein
VISFFFIASPCSATFVAVKHPDKEFYAFRWRKLLVCHELHARVPNRHVGIMNGTDGWLSRTGMAAPTVPRACSDARVQSMHTGVPLVTRALARAAKGHILHS